MSDHKQAVEVLEAKWREMQPSRYGTLTEHETDEAWMNGFQHAIEILKLIPCRDNEKLEHVLAGLHGNKETFRAILTDQHELLGKMCRYAALKSRQKKLPAWSIVSDITGHGSGVSSAIYHLYKPSDVEGYDER